MECVGDVIEMGGLSWEGEGRGDGERIQEDKAKTNSHLRGAQKPNSEDAS